MLSRLKKDEWIIAIRKRGEEYFRIIPNTLRYWCADPFVKEIDGHTFLLFEMYDRLKGKGLIGYRKFDGIKWGKPKVLIEDATHLSYPFVYEENGKMYIMPESNRAGHLYRVELSLTDGELTISNKTVLKTGRYADTTRLELSGKTYYFTTPIIKDNVSELKIYCDGFESDVKIDSRIDSTNARMGGAFITDGGNVYRVSQDCGEGYGKALNFSKCRIIDGTYTEELIKKLTVRDVSLNTSTKYDGIHTYNSDSRYEVIYLKKENKINIVRLIGYALTKMKIIKK